jgi:predicted  nucleic acid-binding Zn-ribbon protein
MNASRTCETLLSNLKTSNLNYSLCESPFGVKLEIKKSFIREKDGTVRSSGLFHDSKLLLDENKSLSLALAAQGYDHQNLLKTNWEFRMELERVKDERVEHMSEKDAMEEDLEKKETEIMELKNTLKHFEVKAGDPEIKKLKHENKELLCKFENSRLEIKNLKSEISALKSEKNNLSVACKASRKEITELSKKNDKEKELLKIKIVDLNTFKQEAKAKERAEIRQNRKAIKKSKKEAKVVVIDSLEHDTTADENENITVDVVTNNRFQTLADTNDDEENQAQDHPEPRLEGESSDQKNSMSGASFFAPRPSTAVTTFTVTSSSVTSSSVTSSSSTFQERIQCDQCLRKCVDERDMEHHIYLWHTDKETQILMAKKKYSTSDSKLVV